MARNGGPIISHGRNLPQRVWVRSSIMPIMGSLTASQIRAISIMAEMAAAESVTISV